MTTETRDDGWKTAPWFVAAVGLAITLLALPVYGLLFAGSVAVGAAMSVGNLWVIANGVRALLSGGPTGRYAALFVVKFSVVVSALYLLFDSRFVQGLPLLIGFAALPVGIVLSQVFLPRTLREG
jgi:hypothetical protein